MQHTSSLLHLNKHKGADLGRRVLLALSLNPSIAVGRTENLVGGGLPVNGQSF
jgi:hypothetical protein